MSTTRHSCRILTKLEFFQQILEQSSNAKFHENSSSGNRVVPCGETDGQTDMTMLTVAFRYLAKSAANSSLYSSLNSQLIPQVSKPRQHNFFRESDSMYINQQDAQNSYD